MIVFTNRFFYDFCVCIGEEVTQEVFSEGV